MFSVMEYTYSEKIINKKEIIKCQFILEKAIKVFVFFVSRHEGRLLVVYVLMLGLLSTRLLKMKKMYSN